MRKVQREEIIDYSTYHKKRDVMRNVILIEKEKRRVHLGDHLTFLFENTDTIRYQIQEMIYIEKITRDDLITHEIETYNDILGEDGVLGCTLLIEFDDALIRDQQLALLKDLPKHIYLLLENNKKVYADYDKKQIGDQKLSAVQFLKFSCSDVPCKIGVDHSLLNIEKELTFNIRKIFVNDLEVH